MVTRVVCQDIFSCVKKCIVIKKREAHQKHVHTSVVLLNSRNIRVLVYISKRVCCSMGGSRGGEGRLGDRTPSTTNSEIAICFFRNIGKDPP